MSGGMASRRPVARQSAGFGGIVCQSQPSASPHPRMPPACCGSVAPAAHSAGWCRRAPSERSTICSAAPTRTPGPRPSTIRHRCGRSPDCWTPPSAAPCGQAPRGWMRRPSNTGGPLPLVVIGTSQGAMVVQQAEADLNNDPRVSSDTTFILIADPNLGVGRTSVRDPHPGSGLHAGSAAGNPVQHRRGDQPVRRLHRSHHAAVEPVDRSERVDGNRLRPPLRTERGLVNGTGRRHHGDDQRLSTARRRCTTYPPSICPSPCRCGSWGSRARSSTASTRRLRSDHRPRLSGDVRVTKPLAREALR